VKPLLFPIAVVIERRALANRWQSEQWEAVEARPVGSVEPVACTELESSAARTRWLWTGFGLELFRSEAENYYLNLSAPDPKVFVMWRFENDRAEPKLVTVSYGEAARMLDAGEQVDGAPMPAEVFAWVAPFITEHYKPEPRKKVQRNDPFAEVFKRDERIFKA